MPIAVNRKPIEKQLIGSKSLPLPRCHFVRLNCSALNFLGSVLISRAQCLNSASTEFLKEVDSHT
jgi:hypothetical protein